MTIYIDYKIFCEQGSNFSITGGVVALVASFTRQKGHGTSGAQATKKYKKTLGYG